MIQYFYIVYGRGMKFQVDFTIDAIFMLSDMLSQEKIVFTFMLLDIVTKRGYR